MGLFSRLFSAKELKPEVEVQEKDATFRPVKEHTSQRRLALSVRNQATLGSGNLSDAITVPPGEDLNEWLVSLID
jgi:hypothetical protein